MKQNWTYKKLGEVATFVNGYPFKPDDWEESGMPIIRIQNLNNPNATYNYYSGSIDARYIVRNGDVLISWSGTLGVYEWNENESALLNQHIFKVVFDKIPIDKVFFKYAVSSRISEMKSKVHGITMQHITKGEFDKTAIPVPPLAEQQRIVSELDLLQGIIDKQQAQLKELDTLAQSIFYDMFGDPVANEKGWEVKRFEDVCVIITDGEHATPRRSVSGIFLLSARNIHNHKLVLDDVDFIDDEEYGRISKRIVPVEGDVLISCSGSVGRVCVAPPNIKFQMVRSVALLRLDKNIMNPTFFEYLICSNYVQQQINDSKVQVAQANLFQGKIKALKTILPPLTLQQEFAEKIEKIERQKTAISQSLAETQKLFDYTMDKYFN